MSRTKYVKGECQACHGHIEFPAEAIGTTIDCPHCAKPTELLLATSPQTPSASRKPLVWAVVGIVVLVAGLVACALMLRTAKQLAAQIAPKEVATTNRPPATNVLDDFLVSTVALEKAPGSSLVYAVGSVTNRSNRQRFGVRVELELLDAAGQKIGTAKDYQAVIEPRVDWRFKALVVESKTVSARLASIKEDK